MSYLTGDAFEQLQYDALWESTENNSLLPYSTSSRKNKALYTTQKRIIGAINEILLEAHKATNNVDNFITRFNTIMGNEIVDTELLTNLQKVDENVFKSIYTLYNKIGTVEGSLLTPEDITKSIDDYMKDFAINLDDLTKNFTEVEQVINSETLNLENQQITLDNTPTLKSDVNIFINGIYYGKDCFDITDNVITWIFKENNNGFDLNLEEFDIIIKYIYNNKTSEEENNTEVENPTVEEIQPTE